MILGIDIGTSACKAAVFDYDGNVIAKVAKGYKVYYPQEKYAEQDPNEWYCAVCDAIKELSENIDISQVCAVGIDGQGWSCIPVDVDGNVLCNTPIWFDFRADKQCEFIKREIGEDKIFSICKNPVQPCYTTPKVMWIRDNYPDIYAKTHMFLQSNSYIAYRLTGVFSQDKSQGYGHFFYDIENSCYDEGLAAEMGIDINKFPPIYESYDVVGTVSEKANKETGLSIGIPVVAGGLDAACGTLGVGVIKPGQTQEQGGQAGGMSICVDTPVADKRLILGNHVVPGVWLLQGGTVAGGAAMEWFANNFGKSFGDDKVFAAIDNEAEKIEAASEGLVFLPYLNGERSPVWNPRAKGVYYGLTFSKTKAHFARATMEGAAYALRHNLETAKSCGAYIDKMYSMGGSANSSVWMQIKADVTQKHMVVPDSDNASTLGAAILAGVGSGIYASFEDAVSKLISIKKEYIPNEENKEKYDRAYQKYINIYECLKGEM